MLIFVPSLEGILSDLFKILIPAHEILRIPIKEYFSFNMVKLVLYDPRK